MHRVSACAQDEFGCELTVADHPCAVIQIFDDRGHSVSLCFAAALVGKPGRHVVGEGETPRVGDLRWFRSAPENMYPSHIVYRDVIDALDRGELADGARVFTQHVGRRGAAQASPEGEISAASLA